jgi:transposase
MTMSPTQTAFNHVVAFEVSKHELVVHELPSDTQCSIANEPKAVRRLLRAKIKEHRSHLDALLVVCEATGGYERHVLEACVELGLACHKAHGARVRHFAKYLGLIAKTDPIDARVLALYGLRTEGLRLYQPPSAEESALKELQARRNDLMVMLNAEGNRLEHARQASVIRSLKAHIASLRKALKALEAEIAALVRKNESFARKVRLMRSLKGVGPVTAVTVLTGMPELGTMAKGEAACLAGLAPINRDSGKSSGPRHIEAGRAAVRRCLYMAALVALQCNPVIKAFAASLKARGKPFKVIITAVMRKLLVILNGILRTGEPWKHAKTA